MKVIAVNNNKGGSLKTTTATNLAGVLASEGKKVLIIDSDNQSNVSLTFGKNPDDFDVGLFDVLIEGLLPEEAIVNVYENLDILPSNDDLIGFDFEVIGKGKKYKTPFTIMKDTCSRLKEEYDFILIDTPPSLSLMVGNVFAFADSVLIPFSPESYSMRSLVKVLGTIDDFKEQFNPYLKVLGVVGTMVNFQTILHQQVMQETRKYCSESEIHLFDAYIPRSIRFASSVAYENVPATLHKKSNDVANSYFELWKEIKENEQTN
ncbi:ParA family protein [Domibacillus epiphyticus]|uniref:Chromosome partitioning protein ParA n=1 Tax=Domibacillus epiphyticus TaxID=1714355 RepID=A0A1V2A5N4_9BACI|nr:ParA family protein [Domibacillus epiphyticus]OMP66329.1 chromosome partitioning protein ParA [Domibacillus epiphyticus]